MERSLHTVLISGFKVNIESLLHQFHQNLKHKIVHDVFLLEGLTFVRQVYKETYRRPRVAGRVRVGARLGLG